MDVESELRVCGIMLCLLFAGYDIGTHWEWGTDLELGVFFFILFIVLSSQRARWDFAILF